MAQCGHFLILLGVCGKISHLHTCARLHDYILHRGLLDKLSDALICMYARCGALAKAQQLFGLYKSRETSTWTALIAAFVQAGRGHDALGHFEQMQREGLSPSTLTFICALKACGIIQSPERGSKIHDQAVQAGLFKTCIKLANTAISMYAKCGSFAKARRILEELHPRNAVSLNALISGYVEHGQDEEALECYEQMHHEGLYPDAVTFICLLKACASLRALEKGEKVHHDVSNCGLLENNEVLGTVLIDMYAKCGAFTKAQQMLRELPVQTAAAWNALISGYADHGASEQAWKCFNDMEKWGLDPDGVTFASILKACRSMAELSKGEEIHRQMAKRGLPGYDIVLGNALVDMYARCGAFAKAQETFEELHTRNATAWNTLICRYVEHGEGEQALDCLEKMKHEGVSPNAITFTCALKACGSIGAGGFGEEIHEEASKQGLLEENVFLGTALVDMYGRCGDLKKAADLLDELPVRDSISWSALIARYAESGECMRALNCFERMLGEGLSPNAVTFASLLKACCDIGAIGTGERFHEKIVKKGLLHDDALLGNALIGMYAKSGALAKARRLLDELPVKDVISWTSLMGGLIKGCEGSETLRCFQDILHEGLSPDAPLFSCVLSVLSRLGLVEDATKWFENMNTDYSIIPDLQHCTCMIDACGRTGHLNRAARIIEKLPFSDSGAWSALLSACNKWGKLDIGEWAFARCCSGVG